MANFTCRLTPFQEGELAKIDGASKNEKIVKAIKFYNQATKEDSKTEAVEKQILQEMLAELKAVCQNKFRADQVFINTVQAFEKSNKGS